MNDTSDCASRESKLWSLFRVLVVAFVVLMVFSPMGLAAFRENAFVVGTQQMSSAIENSLARQNLEGVGALVSVGVRDCIKERRSQSLSGVGPGLFAFDALEAQGAQTYRACYIEQLESARLLSNPASLNQALQTVVRQ